MGVYYIVVNDSKKEYLDPFDFDDHIKRSGVLKGLHGECTAELLLYPPSEQKYDAGYWCGDSIRILGDIYEEENEKVLNEYSNIGYPVLARSFEYGQVSREEVVSRAENNASIFQGLIKENEKYKYVNLNYSLGKLNESKT